MVAQSTKDRAKARRLLIDGSLGMPYGTAIARLRKALLFMLAKAAGLTRCYRCSDEIEDLDDFTIEHKKSWLRSEDPVGDFFNLDNIAFSHFGCNSGAASKPTKKYASALEKKRVLNSRRCRSGDRHDASARRDRYARTGS